MKNFPLLLFFFSSFLFSQEKKTDTINQLKTKAIEMGINGFFSKDTLSIKKANTDLLKLYHTTNDSTLLANYYHYKALYHWIKLSTDSTFYYYHQSKNISKQLNDSLAVGRRLLSIANLQREAKDYLGSEITSIEALNYLEPIEANGYILYVYNNLGLVSQELGQKKEAIKYYENALKINKLDTTNSKDSKESHLYIINNLGLLYQQQNRHNKAITYFKKGLGFDSIRHKHPTQYALLLENLAASNFLSGNTNKVLQQYEEVSIIRKKLKDYWKLSTTHINLTDFYNQINKPKKAVFHAKKALAYAKQTGNNKYWLEALQRLSQLNTGKKSKQYLQEYIHLNDSLFQKERTLKNQFAKIRYETDKKEKENTVLKSENEKKQAEIAYHKQQKTISWLFSALFLILLTTTIAAVMVRRKRLAYKTQLQTAEAREQERQQIAKSLHDEVAGDLRLLHQKLQQSQQFEVAQQLDTVKNNVRDLSHQLSSINFEKVSFRDQIINLVTDYFEPTFKIFVDGLEENDWKTVNNSIKRLLYLGIRESIQNSKKHANASKITVSFSVHKKSVLLSIADNGTGFDMTTNKKGIGLQNLQERVEELNGELLIESELNNGTKTSIQVPINV